MCRTKEFLKRCVRSKKRKRGLPKIARVQEHRFPDARQHGSTMLIITLLEEEGMTRILYRSNIPNLLYESCIAR